MREGARAQAADARLTRRRLVVAGLAALLGGPRTAHPAPSDVAGWDRARWGMTESEIRAAFGADLQPVDPPLAFGPLEARQAVPRVVLAGRPFVAFLQLDRASGRLAQVLLRYRGRNPTHSDFVAVAAALTAALGMPAAADSQRDYSGSFPSFAASRQWRLAQTTVHLAYRDPNAEPYSGVRKELTVRYAPAAPLR